MNSVSMFLMAVAGIFLIGAAGEVIFRRTQIPDVIWLIVAGVLIGPIGGFVSRPALNAIAPYFGALTLVVVLFEGGSRLNLARVATAAPRSALLAILTFAFSVAGVVAISLGAYAMGLLPPEWTWKQSVLLGTILGGSSSVIIMPAVARAGLRDGVADLVNLESAFTDVFCVVGATAMMDIILARAAAAGSPTWMVVRSFGYGVGAGALLGAAWLFLLRWLNRSEHAYPITLSVLLVLYVVIDGFGGSAALGILAFALVVGNAAIIGRTFKVAEELDLSDDVRGFHSQMTFIIKSFFFTFLGAMLGPPWGLIALGLLLGLALFAARVPGVYLATIGGDFRPGEKQLVSAALPRGMAAGVLATMPVAAGVPATEQLPSIVFACALTTIVIFAAGFPLAQRVIARARTDGALHPTELDAMAAASMATALPEQLATHAGQAAAAGDSAAPEGR